MADFLQHAFVTLKEVIVKGFVFPLALMDSVYRHRNNRHSKSQKDRCLYFHATESRQLKILLRTPLCDRTNGQKAVGLDCGTILRSIEVESFKSLQRETGWHSDFIHGILDLLYRVWLSKQSHLAVKQKIHKSKN